MEVVIVAGNTDTARIDGISAAGANPDLLVHTPSADLEIIEYGQPIRAPVVPVSPSGCPTPAVVTRAVRELLGFEVISVDAGLARSTGAPTVNMDGTPGADIRTQEPVPSARAIFRTARTFAAALPVEELVIGETIPGGTTTALGVLTALGERAAVSSSLPENPLSLKHEIVEEALSVAGLEPGGAAGQPVEAVHCVGDPVLATVAGLVVGAIDADIDVTLAGGTQMVAVAALVRHTGIEVPLSLATTSFIAADETAAIDDFAADLNLDLTVTDPKFDRLDHPAADAYVVGEAKEGVGMGGALSLADRAGVSMTDVHERVVEVYDRLVADEYPVQA